MAVSQNCFRFFTQKKMTASQFFSTTKFVESIQQLAKENKLPKKLEKNELISFAHVFYQGKDCYEGKFDNMNIRPIYIKLHSTNQKDIFIKHEQIPKLLNSRPILSIKQNMYRSVPKGKDRLDLWFAMIDFQEEISSDGYRYYRVDLYKENCNRRKELILNQIQDISNDDSSDESDSATV